jgi:hypothetical protein
MVHHPGPAAQATRAPRPVTAVTGVPAGTGILTLDGLLPAEHLTPGDRVITRRGASRLRALSVTLVQDAAMIRIAPGALGHDRPDRPLHLPAGQPLLLRDWRAAALFGAAQAMVPAARLADGGFVVPVTLPEVRLFALHFDAPEVVYADGVELGCDPLEQPEPAAVRR